MVKIAGIISTSKGQAGEVLHQFAGILKDRGWKIGGLLQETICDTNGRKLGMEIFALDGSERLPIHQNLGKKAGCNVDPQAIAEASAIIRRGIAAKSDLIIVNKFAGLEAQGQGLSQEMLDSAVEGIPFVTTLAPEYIEAFVERFGETAQILPPNLAALWCWWGKDKLYRDLVLGIPAIPVTNLTIGLNWIMVETEKGAGLAHTPPKEGWGCKVVAEKSSLQELAKGFLSPDIWERALGLAAINAHYNQNVKGEVLNGRDFLTDEPEIVSLGRFPGLSGKLKVIEKNPQAGEYPEFLAESLFAGAEAGVITASALINRYLPPLLEGGKRMLLGPGTPLTPRLFSYGLDILAGFVIDDPRGLGQALSRGAGMREIRPFGRMMTITSTFAEKS